MALQTTVVLLDPTSCDQELRLHAHLLVGHIDVNVLDTPQR